MGACGTGHAGHRLRRAGGETHHPAVRTSPFPRTTTASNAMSPRSNSSARARRWSSPASRRPDDGERAVTGRSAAGAGCRAPRRLRCVDPAPEALARDSADVISDKSTLRLPSSREGARGRRWRSTTGSSSPRRSRDLYSTPPAGAIFMAARFDASRPAALGQRRRRTRQATIRRPPGYRWLPRWGRRAHVIDADSSSCVRPPAAAGRRIRRT